MNPECPNFDLQAAQERLLRFGFCSIPIDTPKALVEEFAARNGATVEKGFFNWVLKLRTEPDPKDREAYFEKIRQENLARRQKLAANKKKKAQTT